MKLNDLNEASFAGAALSKLGNALRGSPEGQLSMADSMAQRQFSQDLIGKLSAGLAQGISGGVIDPNPTPSTNQPAPAATASPAVPQTPAQIRQQKQAAAAATANKQAVPVAKQPEMPVATPAQIRQQKQAAAAAAANKQAVPAPVAMTPAQIRQQKQAAATRNAQSQMGLHEAAGQFPFTISSYVQNFVKKFMGNVDVSSLKSVADEVQSSYAKDKGKKALNKLAAGAYSLYHTDGRDQSAMSPMASPATSAPQPSSQASPVSTLAATPAKTQSVYKQVKDLLGQLNKQQKGYILKALEKETVVPAATKVAPLQAPSPTKAQPTANFNQPMSYGKTTMNAPAGIPNPVTAGSRAAKVSRKRIPAKQVAENKTYKLWGTGNASK